MKSMSSMGINMNSFRNAISCLIIINAAVFMVTFFLKVNIGASIALYFPQNPNFGAWQFLTHMFVHGGIAHILFNMYGLWAFGTPLLRYWGNARFVAYFLVTGLGAGLVYTAANYYQFNVIYKEILALGGSPEYIQEMLQTGRASATIVNALTEQRLLEFFSIYRSPVVGASGAVYGVLVAFAMMYPHAKMALIFLPYPIKSMYFVPIIIAGDLFFGVTRYSVGNVAHFAHVGGALVGLIIMIFWRLKLIERLNNKS